MMRSTVEKILIIVMLILIPGAALAVDSAHEATSSMDCGDCHWVQGASAPWSGTTPLPFPDDSLSNTRCVGCHVDGGPLPQGEPHSSNFTGTKYYSVWNAKCIDCHNPHYQRQERAYKTATHLVTGTIVSVGAFDSGNNQTTVTLTSSLTADYSGYYFQPDNRYPFYYKIKGNASDGGSTLGATQVLVKGDVLEAYIRTGNVYAISYGKFIKDVVDYVNPDGVSVTATVKMFAPSGDFSSGDPNNTGTDLCYGCHLSANPPPGISSHTTSSDCASCHNHEAGFTPSGACDTCHGQSGGTGAPLIQSDLVGAATSDPVTGHGVGAHPRHVVTQSYTDCQTCHNGHLMPTIDKVMTISFSGLPNTNGSSAQYDGTALLNSYTYSAGVTSSTGTQDCSSVYCHSNVQGANGSGAPTSYDTPAWGGTSPSSVSSPVVCGSCHESDGTGIGLMSTGTHTKHVNQSTYDMPCANCHNNAGAANQAIHVNGIINVNLSSTYGGTYNGNGSGNHSPGQGYGACATVYCHSDGQAAGSRTYRNVTWGTTLAGDCTGCHGNDAGSASAMATNLHGKHVNNASVIGTNFECSECHTTTVQTGNNRALNATTGYQNHVDTVRTVQFDTSLNPSGQYSSLACSNLYCHSNGKIGTAVGAYVNPSAWNTSATLGCNGCHGTGNSSGWPNYSSGGTGTATANSHDRHVNTSSIGCAECHNATTTNGTAIRSGSTTHIDTNTDDVVFDPAGNNASAVYTPGVGNKSCSSTYCHGNGAPQWGASIACGDCHTVNNQIAGAHSYHWEAAGNAANRDATNLTTQGQYLFNCGVCHFNVPHADGSVNASRTAQVAFDGTIAGGGTYAEGTAQGSDPNNTSFNWTAATCSSTYCHTDGRGGNPNNTSFNWASARVNDCKQCHNYTVASGLPMTSGKHFKHIDNATTKYAYNCSRCHSVTMAGNSMNDKRQHLDHQRDVNFDSLNPSGNWTSPNCSGLYCHSNGAGGAPNTAVNWTTTTLPTNCTGCHNNDVASASPMATGNHTEHVNNASVIGTNRGCADCHNATVTDNRTIIDPAGYANHVNGSANVGIALGGTYTDPDCSSTYCHSTGKAGVVATGNLPGAYGSSHYSTMTWGDTGNIGCNGCHGKTNAGGYPDYTSVGVGQATSNSHQKHAGDSLIACSNCHINTTTNNTSIASGSTAHLNQSSTNDVVFTGGVVNPSKTGLYNGNKSCSNIYCHDPSNTNVVSPQWGDTLPNSADCSDCHGSNNGTTTGQGEMSSGKHQVHMGATGNAKAAFACGRCHAGTVTTPNDKAITGALHTNSVKDVVYDSLNSAATSNTCNNVYCHSDGKGAYNNQTLSTAWASGAALNCKGCHGDLGSSVYGEPDYATTGGGADRANSHNSVYHVNTAADCQKCHLNTTTDGVTISGPAQHVNGTFDVAITNVYDYDTNPTNNYTPGVGNKSCSNTTCHGGVSPKWGTDLTGVPMCTRCHGDQGTGKAYPPNDTDGNTSATDEEVGAHVDHMEMTHSYTTGITCTECHATLYSIPEQLGHLDARPAEVPFTNAVKAKYNTSSPSYNSGAHTCSNVYCHGAKLPGGSNNGTNTAPVWNNASLLTGTPSISGDCAVCHGAPPNIAPHDAGTHNTFTACHNCHPNVTTSGTFTTPSEHINGTVEYNDNCSSCHSAATLSASHALHNDQIDTYLNGKSLTGGDYGNASTGWYAYSTTADETAQSGTGRTIPRAGCGQCHPDTSSTHLNSTVNLKLNPSSELNIPALNVKLKNNTTDSVTGTSGSSIVCASVYCHSDGYKTGTLYGYQSTPDWYGGSFAGDKCAACHGNSPTGSSAHAVHVVGVHYDNIYNGSNGLATAGNTNTSSHGNASTSTTINCNVCHNSTVTASANDKNTVCTTCHTGGALMGTMKVVTGSTVHVNGTPDVTLKDGLSVLSKAQLKALSPSELSSNWQRMPTSTDYKTSGAYDQALNALNTSSMYVSADKRCNNIACHNGRTVAWTDRAVSCNSCHTALP